MPSTALLHALHCIIVAISYLMCPVLSMPCQCMVPLCQRTPMKPSEPSPRNLQRLGVPTASAVWSGRSSCFLRVLGSLSYAWRWNERGNGAVPRINALHRSVGVRREECRLVIMIIIQPPSIWRGFSIQMEGFICQESTLIMWCCEGFS